jgi:hypothetical protein
MHHCHDASLTAPIKLVSTFHTSSRLGKSAGGFTSDQLTAIDQFSTISY